MAGRFEGLSDLAWQLFADIFPPKPIPSGRGMPHPPFRQVVNTLLYVLLTRCRWYGSPARAAMGIEKRRASVAPALADGWDPRGHVSPDPRDC
jgi:hypothetical protein